MQDQTVYQQIKKLAAPVVKYYLGDLTEHDLRLCNALKRNDVILWAPRECGTCTVIIQHNAADPERELRLAYEALDAYDVVMHPAQWYWATCHADRRGTVRKVKSSALRSYFDGRRASLKRAQKEAA